MVVVISGVLVVVVTSGLLLLAEDVFEVTDPIGVEDVEVVASGLLLVVVTWYVGDEEVQEALEDLEMVDVEVTRVVDTVGMSVVNVPVVDETEDEAELVVAEGRMLLVVVFPD